jgi:hypothetical protein
MDDANLGHDLSESERMRVHLMCTSNELLLEREQAFKVMGAIMTLAPKSFDHEFIVRFVFERTQIPPERVSELLTRAREILPK